MKSILQNVKTGEVTMEEIPPPKVRPGFVLVKNVCSLVSAGTEKTVLEFSRASYLDKARKRPDLFRKVLNKVKHEGILKTWESVNNLMEKPLQLGYSSAGIVMEKGLDVTDIQVGQKVACAGYLYATHSEVVSVPRNLIVPLPDGVSFEEASFVTLGAIAMQGIRLAGLELGEQVVVYGLGLVGMITVQLAIAAGCKVIGVDIDPKKIEKVREYGALGVPAGEDMAAKILNFTKDCGADKVLLCAATRSNEPVEKIPEFTRQKGILVVVGEVSLNLPRRLYYDKEIDVRISRSYGPGRYDMSYEEGGVDYPYAYVRWTENRNMEAVLDLIAGKKLDFISLITHRFKIEEAGSAYQLMEGKINEPYLGIVIQYKEALAQPEKKISDTVSYHSGFKKKTGNLYFGVIGAGQFARALLLPAFHSQKGVVFKKICTLSGVSAAVAAKKFKASEATSSADSVFKDTQIDGLLLATRHDSHARYVMMGLENKMAVFVEKPLATTLDDLDAIKSFFDDTNADGPFLMVGYNRRFSPLSKLLKETLHKFREPISIIYRVNAGFIPDKEWVHDEVSGGGRIIGECCHFVDFLTFIIGASPAYVTAQAMKKNGKTVPDVVTITLEYPEGSLGTIHYFSNGHSALPKEYIEVFQGGVSAQLLNFRELHFHGIRSHGKTSYLNQVKGYKEEAESFITALRDGQPPPIPFRDLYLTTKATLLADLAIRSGESGRFKVDES